MRDFWAIKYTDSDEIWHVSVDYRSTLACQLNLALIGQVEWVQDLSKLKKIGKYRVFWSCFDEFSPYACI